MEGPCRVALVDDHAVVLDSLATILTQSGLDVVAAVSTHAALWDALYATHPMVVVMEARVAGVETADVLRELVRRFPDTKFVILTGDCDPRSIQIAMASGASGYVHKTRNVSALLRGLERVLVGQIVIEASIERLAEAAVAATRSDSEMLRLAAYLTPRERECLALLTDGRDTSTIATAMGVSATTVRTHVQSILTKLGVHSRLEAASVAARHRLVDGMATA